MNADLFWPTLTRNNNNIADKVNEDICKIQNSKPKSARTVVLDEARRLYDQEQNRRSTTDSKAGIYIAISTALIPTLLSLTPFIMSGERPIVLNFIILCSFLLSIITLSRCALWSHEALQVSPFYQLDWKVLISSKSTKKLEICLAKQLLCNLRKNYELTNEAVTCIKMAHALVTSAWIWLFICILVRLFSYIYVDFIEPIN
ncbi:hypothetical protein L2719_10125 [Shewanella schlegeliana]|uniref:Uncharacterized protein n=1 Tax=Shewanella schlegeliana TaxID=190308 RepID=A0ABS1SX70_9GAMM|nr:hypothetical protein [Shewanella schlegeliana]MBL4912590.1 hypothetical protein [Shewanella schlegeliana]MCL1109903.1 hypothetical protein [Shewanella schlegeliana]GIU32525.1 hypothetical protein TUM4433_25590 [Shewanella schlegeliana]